MIQLTRQQRAEPLRDAEFERLWALHRPRVWRLTARLSGSLDSADDLTQEVSMRAFQAFGGFRKQSSTFTWFYRIAVNVVLRDRERVRPTVDIESKGITVVAGSESDPEALAIRAELCPAVREALDRLPADYRTVMVLQVYEGLKYREIADILEVPIETVKYRRHHGMLRLREELKDYAM